MVASADARGKALLTGGDFKGAIEAFSVAFDEAQRTLGLEHPDTLTALGNLGVAYYHAGRLNDARALQEALAEVRLRVSGEGHADTFKAMGNLAWTLYAQGDLRAARDQFEATLLLAERALPAGHELVLSAKDNLAWTLQVLGEHGGARKLQEEVLAVRRAMLGDDNEATVGTMGTLAATLYRLGELVQARVLQEEAVAYKRRTSAVEDSFTLIAIGNLALTLHALGDLAGARALEEEVLEVRERTVGEEHPERLKAMTNLAVTLTTMGDYEGARALQERAIRKQREFLGSQHHETVLTMANLVSTLRSQGELERASELADEVLALQMRTFGERHMHTLSMMATVGQMHFERGEREAARKVQEEVVRLSTDEFGGDYTNTLEAMQDLAGTLAALGELSRAHDLQTRVQANLAASLGEEHPLTLHAMDALASIVLEEGQPAGARELLESVAARRKAVLGERHPDTVASIVNLAVDFARTRTDPADRAACVAHLAEAFALLAEPTVLLLLSRVCAEAAARLAELVVDLNEEDARVAWREELAGVSARWVDLFRLAPPSQTLGLRPFFVRFHAAWLGLCTRHRPGDVPRVLAALQGREMRDAILEELQTGKRRDESDDARSRYLAALTRVRAIRLQLTVLAGMRGLPRSVKVEEGDIPGHNRMPPNARSALEKELIAEYDVTHGELTGLQGELAKEDAGFALALEPAPVGESALASQLGEDEVLVLLYGLPASGEALHFACCVTRDRPAINVELPALGALLVGCERYGAQFRAGRMGKTVRGVATSEIEVEAEPGPSLGEIATMLDHAFWAPLRATCPGASKWHIATHQNLHNLPLAMGLEHRPPREEVHVYPGVAFFARGGDAPAPVASVHLHVDPAWATRPIPCVEADAALLQELVPGATVSRGAKTLAVLRDAGKTLGAFGASSHGEVVDNAREQAQTSIVIDAERRESMDATKWLTLAARPSLAVLATCVGGRIVEPFGGEPFGLISAILLRGCQSVVGSLAVVPDFYTPLLMGLFWSFRSRTRDSAEALRAAKRALRTGDWPDGFPEVVRRAYAPVLAEVLRRVGDGIDEALALFPGVSGWLLPDAVRRRFFDRSSIDDHLRFMEEHCGTLEKRDALVAAVIDRLLVERAALPAAYVEHLCAWFHVFGRDSSAR